MYRVSNIRVVFGQSDALGPSDSGWTCATAYIQGICSGLEWEFQLEPELVAWVRQPWSGARKLTSALVTCPLLGYT